jgi:hypothetical protein
MAGMALWRMKDWKWRGLFLHKLAELIAVPDEFVTESKVLIHLSQSIKKFLFQSFEPVKHFYDQTTQCNYLNNKK